jgi:hypothetical protein
LRYDFFMADSKPFQLDKFIKTAREHDADEDEAHWDDRLKKIARAKPKPDKPE